MRARRCATVRRMSDEGQPPLQRPERARSGFHPFRLDRRDALSLALVLAWGLWLLAPGLSHPGIQNWDESFHQAAARGTFATFFAPHLYADPLFPVNPADWEASGVWLHKPTGPLWFAATVMHVTGVTPLALRLGALLGELGAACALFLLLRKAVARPWALVAALGFLALPFGWMLTQALFFSDAADCTLVGFVTVAMALLVCSVERESLGLAALAGVAVGLGYLCKTVLSLAPLGVACALFVLARLRFCRGPRLTQVLAMGGATVVIAAPWNVYCALTWPAVYHAESAMTFSHVFNPSHDMSHIGPWSRPADAVFNELLGTEFQPLTAVVPLLAGVWLLLRAISRRELPVVALALWLWATWLVHSLVDVKVPAQVWSAAPAVAAGWGLILSDAWRTPALSGGVLGALVTPWFLEYAPWLGKVREALPKALEQTRKLPGLTEGVLLCAFGAAVATLCYRRSMRWPGVALIFGIVATVELVGTLLVQLPVSLRAQREPNERALLTSYTREVGLAVDRAVPKRSVLFQDVDRDPPGHFEVQSGMFWSGRMNYRGPVNLAVARAKGYHAYVLSPAAERLEPLPQVPGSAWLRAYDAEKPTADFAPLPPDIEHVDVTVNGLAVRGFARAPRLYGKDAYVFYVHADDVPRALTVVFVKTDGTEEHVVIQPEASLRRRDKLAHVPWFLMPTLGPHDLRGIRLGAQFFPLTP